jgi:hypothetical protein
MTAALLVSPAGVASAAPPVEGTSPPSAEEIADVQPRDLVIDERGLGYLRRASGELVPYGHSIAAEKRPVEVREASLRRGRPGAGSSSADGAVTLGEWEGGQVTTSSGRVLVEMAGEWFVCSGTAVTDDTSGRSIVLTAAHCIYDDVDKAFATQALFIPNQDDGRSDATDADCRNDPEGCWIIDHGVVDQNWTTRTFPDNIFWDYGFYVVSDTGAWSTSDRYANPADRALDGLGTLDIDVTARTGDTAHALGYPYDVDPELMYCTEPLATEETYNGYWLDRCGLTGGTSGGPWVQPMDDSGGGPVFSVSSWGYTRQPGMGGPILALSSADELLTVATSSDLDGTGQVVDASDATTANPPRASFTASCAEFTCTFDASASTDSDGTVEFYRWAFSDGDTGSGSPVSHTYADGGTYQVTLTVTDDDGASDTATGTVTVSAGSDARDGSSPVLSPGQSVNNGATWTAVVIMTGTVGQTTLGTWNLGDSSMCTIPYGSQTCTVKLTGIPKRNASATYSDSQLGEVTVTKP